MLSFSQNVAGWVIRSKMREVIVSYFLHAGYSIHIIKPCIYDPLITSSRITLNPSTQIQPRHQHIYSIFNLSNCLIVSSKPLCSASKSANFFFSTSCNSRLAFFWYFGSSMIFFCLSIPAAVFSSFLVALAISPSKSTRPLTCKKTAAEAETA